MTIQSIHNLQDVKDLIAKGITHVVVQQSEKGWGYWSPCEVLSRHRSYDAAERSCMKRRHTAIAYLPDVLMRAALKARKASRKGG